MKHRIVSAVAFALMFGGAAVAGPEPHPETVRYVPAISDATIERFAETAIAVSKIRKDYMMRYYEVDNDADRASLIAEANARLSAHVAATPGLSFSEYQRINRDAQEDPVLNARIARALKAHLGTDQ